QALPDIEAVAPAIGRDEVQGLPGPVRGPDIGQDLLFRPRERRASRLFDRAVAAVARAPGPDLHVDAAVVVREVDLLHDLVEVGFLKVRIAPSLQVLVHPARRAETDADLGAAELQRAQAPAVARVEVARAQAAGGRRSVD